MKRILLSISAVLAAIAIQAMPVKPGICRNITLADGTVVKAELVGDEHLTYWRTADGACYRQTPSAGVFSKVELSALQSEYDAVVAQKAAREKAILESARTSMPVKKVEGSKFQGKKKCLVILANFADTKFKPEHTLDLYKQIINGENYSDETLGFKGSVRDYFKAQSGGQFEIDFDVVGPVDLPKGYAGYGKNDASGRDQAALVYPMVEDAVNLAKDQVTDWKQYDWDGDGLVEEVFVLYAGHGQATYPQDPDLVWPHKSAIDPMTVADGVKVSVYACSCELGATEAIDGIGAFCHEFSHCMGLPDMYDTNYGSTPTMGDWDLLAGGSYNGPQGIGWCPAGWTSYERAYAGWLELTELKAGDIIKGMTSLEEADGKAYVIYNDNHKDEYYLLENHKGMGWDKYTPENGLLIIHVDYDKDLFDNNIVNSKGEFTPAEGYDRYFTNDHPRMAPFSRVRSIQNDTYFSTYPMDAPRGVVDSLTDTSKPAAELYNALADGSKLMGKPVYNIEKDDDGNISFTFMTKEKETDAIQDIAMAEDTTGDDTVYDITGKKAGRIGDIKNGSLKAGIYIIGGKRLQKKVMLK